MTISRWLSQYRQGGLENLFTISTSPGRQSLISETVKDKLKGELEDSEGFDSYTEIHHWMGIYC
ncbi:MAG: helix-turn-helix domain-containing protein [Okeania sp. SIO2C9]|uniref:helix-turn-helix domain-containing protein n=1 Tax=Okeania sp. SIO2C9 TaxID=2607791 RepID=UPI0013C2918F|nr:helix-turn-helix domain-containing protein [Okeania sp. SIO2C9]NEQ71835.1 helix-turn-helix domain-containing protein [Okeania sp. SIO2C9]